MGRVLIIGGGVAGPTAALALRKAGLEPAVYEAYPVGGEDVGAFLTIMNNGMDALAAIDAAEAVEAVSFPATTVEFLDGAGRRRPSSTSPARSRPATTPAPCAGRRSTGR
jgi:2-polyprenyl-6-methoxyphenol hydroxylase-like FAD-dependent oxidoreductase